MIQPLLHRCQLRLELLVLNGQTAIRVLEEGFEVLYPFVSGEEFALRDPRLLLESRVLVNKLREAEKSLSMHMPGTR